MAKSKKKPKKTPSPQQLSPQKQQEQRQILKASAFHSGPLPPPAVLSQYNNAVPDAAERILKMAESQ